MWPQYAIKYLYLSSSVYNRDATYLPHIHCHQTHRNKHNIQGWDNVLRFDMVGYKQLQCVKNRPYYTNYDIIVRIALGITIPISAHLPFSQWFPFHIDVQVQWFGAVQFPSCWQCGEQIAARVCNYSNIVWHSTLFLVSPVSQRTPSHPEGQEHWLGWKQFPPLPHGGWQIAVMGKEHWTFWHWCLYHWNIPWLQWSPVHSSVHLHTPGITHSPPFRHSGLHVAGGREMTLYLYYVSRHVQFKEAYIHQWQLTMLTSLSQPPRRACTMAWLHTVTIILTWRITHSCRKISVMPQDN